MHRKKTRLPALLGLIMPLVCGIVIEYYFQWPISYLVPTLGFSLLIVSAYLFRRKSFQFPWLRITAFLTFFVFGLYLAFQAEGVHRQNFFAKVNPANNVSQCRIVEAPSETAKTIALEVTVDFVGDHKTTGRALLYLQKTPEAKALKTGDIVQTPVEFSLVTSAGNPDEFDYPRYLRLQNIQHSAYAAFDEWQLVGHQSNVLQDFVDNSRNYLETTIENSQIQVQNQQIAKALLLGQKDQLDQKLLESYSAAGATHILAVSGLHVGILMLILGFIYKPIKFFRKGKWIYVIVLISSLWLFALITGMSPSVLRAATMFSFVVIGSEIQRDSSIYQSILVSAFILILLDPYVIFSVGFQLSYAAVIGIVYLHPKIYPLIYSKWWLLDKIWQITAVSIAAQLATLPLVLYYFHQLPTYSILTNLVVIPGAFLVLFIGVFLFAFSWSSFITDIFAWCLDLILSIMTAVIHWIESFMFSVIPGFSLNLVQVVLLYTLLFLLIGGLSQKNKSLLLSAALCLCVLLTLNLHKNVIDSSQNEVVYYNAAQNDAIDVIYGKQNNFLTSLDVLEDKNVLKYITLEHWTKRLGKISPTRTYSIDSLRSPIRIGHETIFFLNQEQIDTMKMLPVVDRIYLRELHFIPMRLIDKWNEMDQRLIIGGGVSYSARNFLKTKIKTRNVIELNDGAVVLRF